LPSAGQPESLRVVPLAEYSPGVADGRRDIRRAVEPINRGLPQRLSQPRTLRLSAPKVLQLELIDGFGNGVLCSYADTADVMFQQCFGLLNVRFQKLTNVSKLAGHELPDLSNLCGQGIVLRTQELPGDFSEFLFPAVYGLN
jgi:hypothetical protein